MTSRTHVVVRVPKKLVFAAVTFALLASGLEVGQRVSDWRKKVKRASREQEIYVIRGETSTGIPLTDKAGGCVLVHDPHLIHRLKPNLDLVGLNADGQRARLTTNSRGFRGPEWVREKPAGTLRVFLLGGSAAFGHGATADDREIASALERLLVPAATASGRRVEVRNAGVQGYTTDEELVLFATELIDFAPDALILLDGWNDFMFSGSAAPDVDPQSGLFRDIERVVERANDPARYVLRLSALFRGLERKVERVKVELGRHPDDEGRELDGFSRGMRTFIEHPRLLPRYRANLERICRLARGVGVHVVLAPQPEVFQRAGGSRDLEVRRRCAKPYEERAKETYPKLVAAAREVALASGEFFCDTTRAFDATDEPIFADPVHVNDRGNELVAAALLPVVARALGLAPSEPEKGR